MCLELLQFEARGSFELLLQLHDPQPIDNPSHTACWWAKHRSLCLRNLACCTCAMRAPGRTGSNFRTSRIAKSTVFIATLVARTCAATIPAPPSPADKWLYPDINTSPTYNYLDTVNASWTSNFVAPYLLLRCQHPNDTVHYAYRRSSWPPARTPSLSNATAQLTTSLLQQQVQPSCR